MEDGKPQKISFFSFESRKQREPGPPLRPLRSDVFTNRPEYHSASGPLVVLLLDGLNTPPGQQVYVRQQILKYLGNLKVSGPGTAILALGNDLSVLQDFTTDSQLLLAAVRGYKGGRTVVDGRFSQNRHPRHHWSWWRSSSPVQRASPTGGLEEEPTLQLTFRPAQMFSIRFKSWPIR